MPTQGQQSGFVKPTGKRARTWTGYWYEYRILNGVEKRYERSIVLGVRPELTKTDAKERLRDHIPGFRPQADSTFEGAVGKYLALKQGDWRNKNRPVMKSLFELHVIPQLGPFPLKAIKPTDIRRGSTKLDPITAIASRTSA
jgi:hypothetical protein